MGRAIAPLAPALATPLNIATLTYKLVVIKYVVVIL